MSITRNEGTSVNRPFKTSVLLTPNLHTTDYDPRLKADLAKSFWDAVRRMRDARRTGEPDLARARATPLVARESVAGSMQEALHRLDAIRGECRALVSRRAALSAGAAVVPLPGLDIGTDVAILIKLLPKINEKFGLTPAQIDQLDTDTKSVVMMFISGLGASLVGRLVTRELVIKVLMKLGVRVTTKGIVKFVPLLGQALSATISFGAMKLLGNQHIDDCHEVARRTLVERAGRAS